MEPQNPQYSQGKISTINGRMSQGCRYPIMQILFKQPKWLMSDHLALTLFCVCLNTFIYPSSNSHIQLCRSFGTAQDSDHDPDILSKIINICAS